MTPQFESAKKAIETLVKEAQDRFDEAEKKENFYEMAKHSTYKGGLEMALSIVKVAGAV